MVEKHSTSTPTDHREHLKMIAYFVDHPVLANVLTVLLVILGLSASWQLNTQLLPDFGIEQVFKLFEKRTTSL